MTSNKVNLAYDTSDKVDLTYDMSDKVDLAYDMSEKVDLTYDTNYCKSCTLAYYPEIARFRLFQFVLWYDVILHCLLIHVL